LEEKQKCQEAGMNDHISKPVDPGALFETVGRFYKPPASAATEETTAPAPAASDEDFPVIDGLDLEDGLARVAGNRKLYQKLLRQFADQQGSSISLISDALAAKDEELAERLAHTLKGVAANLGAGSVRDEASGLEKLVREKAAAPEITASLEKLAAVLAPMLSSLNDAFPAPSAPVTEAAPTEVDPDQTREAAKDLAKLLAEFDSAAVDFVESNGAALQAAFPAGAWPEFKEKVGNYDFSGAEEQLTQALNNFNS
jgi:two-component system sensor histidine kinase/response regulator